MIHKPAHQSRQSQSAAYSSRKSTAKKEFSSVNLSEEDGVRHLHFGSLWIQGSMVIGKPLELFLEYIQRMNAWLLFFSADAVKECHAMQLGLGAGSITRFTALKLGMRTTAVELNPAVIAACHQFFALPRDLPNLNIWNTNAEAILDDAKNFHTVDVLSVDLYDADAAAPVLDSLDFYASCRRLLTSQGILAVNLFGRNAHLEESKARISQAFGAENCLSFPPTREGNTVVLGFAKLPFGDTNRIAGSANIAEFADEEPRQQFSERASEIEVTLKLPAQRWLHQLRDWRDLPII